jgi:hypothetical protein
MRANITINDAGIILAASNAPPPTGGAAVSRVNQKMSITLGAQPTVPALLSLIRALRAVKTTIRLYNAEKMTAHNSPRVKFAFIWRKWRCPVWKANIANYFKAKSNW